MTLSLSLSLSLTSFAEHWVTLLQSSSFVILAHEKQLKQSEEIINKEKSIMIMYVAGLASD